MWFIVKLIPQLRPLWNGFLTKALWIKWNCYENLSFSLNSGVSRMECEKFGLSPDLKVFMANTIGVRYKLRKEEEEEEKRK